MKPVVVVENVSKKYSRRADVHRQYGIKALINELLGRSQDTYLRQDEFLAVDDISLALYPGDSLALIGRNGCGKTTTLKMLNGTLKPDAGKIIIDGRVQALIALGAGFNPRLSGQENIFNAAAVLGLSNKETKAIIDEVVDFAELDDFIDSPVQTFSSGMHARLGFAVAVHLKPDILLIDEILSVGDYAFQNKCFAKMQQLKHEGVTILLVSHSHAQIIQLCEHALWLHKGQTLKTGSSKAVVKAYLQDRAAVEDPYVSPLYGDLRGLPPMLLQVGEAEVLLDDSVRFADKAERTGVPVRLDTWPDMPHVFQMFAPFLPEASQALAVIAGFISANLGT